MAKKYLLVRVDTNDADYVEQLSPITDEELSLLLPLFEAIKAFKPYSAPAYKAGTGSTSVWRHYHNFPYGEVCRDDLGERSPAELYPDLPEAVELFQDNYLPYVEYGCHTVDSVRVLTVTDDEEII